MSCSDHENRAADGSKRLRPCPICGKPAVHDLRPFCSKRCADIDLHRWLSGVYAVPASEDEEDGAGPAERGEE